MERLLNELLREQLASAKFDEGRVCDLAHSFVMLAELGRLGRVPDSIAEAAVHQRSRVREIAASTLGYVPTEEAETLLAGMLDDTVRESALQALKTSSAGRESTRQKVRTILLGADSRSERELAANLLGEWFVEEAVDDLRSVKKAFPNGRDEHGRVHHHANNELYAACHRAIELCASTAEERWKQVESVLDEGPAIDLRTAAYLRRRGATWQNVRSLLDRRRDTLKPAQAARHLSAIERLGGTLTEAESKVVRDHAK